MNTSNISNVRDQDTPQESAHEASPPASTVGPSEKNENAGDGPAVSEWQPGLDGRLCSGNEGMSAEPVALALDHSLENHVSVSAGALAAGDDTVVTADRTPAFLPFEGSPCEDEPETPITPAPAQPMAYASPLEPPEKHELNSPIPENAPNLLAFRQRQRDSFAQKLVCLPSSGGGLHDAIHYTVLAGLAEGMSPDAVAEAVFTAAEGKGRSSGELYGEIWRSVHSAVHYLSGSTETATASRPRKQEVDYGTIERTVLGNPKLDKLIAASKPMPPSRADIMGLLYPAGSLVCCGAAKDKFRTFPREAWQGNLEDVQFVVPSPMSKKSGTTVDRRPSEKCNDNTGPRTFQVIEFDFKPEAKPECAVFVARMAAQGWSVMDINAGLHFQLQDYLPLVMAVSSGNASIHGWYRCAGIPEARIAWFQCYAQRLGADPALFCRSQFTRFPGGLRDNGNVQEILYWNPEVLS